MILDKKVQLERMTWPQVEEAVVEARGVVIIPIGAVEEHGPHLPVGTDSIETYEIGLRAAEKSRVVITPLVWFGNSRSFMDFPGTIAINPETVKLYTRDVVISLIKHGFRKPIILDGHGGNYGVLDILVEDIMLEYHVKAIHILAWELATLPKPNGVPPYDGHGGSSETSAMMFLCPSDVDKDKFADSEPKIDITKYGSIFPSPSGYYEKGPAIFPMMMKETVNLGHHGTPRFGTGERGKGLLEVKTNALVSFINALKNDDIKYLRTNQK